jgi:hypothetical protein
MLLAPAVATAQGDCFPATDSHEAKTFAILSTPIAFTAAAGGGHGLSLGIEAASIPEVPRDLATPTTCRPGKGPENTNPLPGLVRLRVEFEVTGWRLSAGWIPPLRASGVKANLVGIGVGRSFALPRAWRVEPRVHAVMGTLHAPVTCSDEAIVDPASECLGGQRSDDRWRPGIVGVEVIASHTGDRLTPHLGVGYTVLRPRFQVDFTNAQGETDNRRVEVDLSRVALLAGATIAAGPLRFTGEGYYTIGDRLAARVVARWTGAGAS